MGRSVLLMTWHIMRNELHQELNSHCNFAKHLLGVPNRSDTLIERINKVRIKRRKLEHGK